MYPDAARQFYLTVGLQFFLGCFAQCSAGQDWICPLPTEWPPRTGSRATLRLHVPPATSVPDASAPSVHVRACSGGEYTCGAAVVEADSDADGVATLHVDQNTSENAYYFELYDALATAPFLIYSPRQPVVGDTDLWIPSSAPSTSLDPAIAVRGEQRMPATGWVWVNIADCVGGNADFLSGAPRVTMSGQGQPYYVDRNGVWDATATGGGTAAFVNVPEGSFSVRVFLDGDTTHAIASAVVPIRAGVETMVSFNYPQFY
jgi:hypothetical protein